MDNIAQKILGQVKDDVNNVLDTKILTHPPDFLYEMILESISSLGYRIIPSNIVINGSPVEDLASVILSWLPKDDLSTADLSINDIPGEQIIQHLISNGWTLIPPHVM